MIDTTKAIAAGLVVLIAAGGVTATTGGIGVLSADQATTTQNVDAAASLENQNVTVTVTNSERTGISNVNVSVDGKTVGTTGTSGTVQFNLTNATDGDDLTITLQGENFSASLDYHVTDNGTLLLLEESYEYDRQVKDDD